MADQSQEEIPAPSLQVYSDDRGRVFLRWHPGNVEIEVERPVTAKTLAAAKKDLLGAEIGSLRRRKRLLEKSITSERKAAHEEIVRTLHPIRKGRWRQRVQSLGQVIAREFVFTLLFLFLLLLPYKGIQWSSEHWPPWLHFVVLGVYALVLGLCIYVIATKENRTAFRDGIQEWFGPRGLFVLPSLIVVTAAAVFASLTFSLYRDGWIVLDQCQGRAVSEGALLDFYIAHFFKLIPLLKLNEVLKWNEPFCYSQRRIGFLILLFQGLVVLPSLAAIRDYWQNRHAAAAAYKYAFVPSWQPGGPTSLITTDRSVAENGAHIPADDGAPEQEEASS